MDWRSRIVAHPDVLVGKPVIKGTRISVELVMELLAAGYTMTTGNWPRRARIVISVRRRLA